MNQSTIEIPEHVDLTRSSPDEQMTGILARDGICTFAPLTSPQALLCFCQRLGTIVKHRDSDEHGLTRISPHEQVPVEDGYQAFTSFHLALHTDGSSLPEPATLVVLWCQQPSSVGGLSLFVDGKRLYQVLEAEYPQVLEALTAPSSAIFAGPQIPLFGSIFTRLSSGKVSLRFRYDGLGYYAAPVCRVLPIFLHLLDQQTIYVTLAQHQGYILQNGRWLHGRTAFAGKRELYRVLVRTDPTTPFGKQVALGFCPGDEP